MGPQPPREPQAAVGGIQRRDSTSWLEGWRWGCRRPHLVTFQSAGAAVRGQAEASRSTREVIAGFNFACSHINTSSPNLLRELLIFIQYLQCKSGCMLIKLCISTCSCLILTLSDVRFFFWQPGPLDMKVSCSLFAPFFTLLTILLLNLKFSRFTKPFNGKNTTNSASCTFVPTVRAKKSTIYAPQQEHKLAIKAPF